MIHSFFRFPQTPHLAWLGSQDLRDDKLLTPAEVEELLDGKVLVEEKVDGANIGFSLDGSGDLRVQNRGSYLQRPFHGQFSRLGSWLGEHEYLMKPTLNPEMIVFGEWCAAKHSVEYDQLPDYFLLFDIYDKAKEQFWSVERRDQWAQEVGVTSITKISVGHYSVDELIDLLNNTSSSYRTGPPEGIVIRKDDGPWNTIRGKIVRPEFIQMIDEHWSRRGIEWNTIASPSVVSRH